MRIRRVRKDVLNKTALMCLNRCPVCLEVALNDITEITLDVFLVRCTLCGLEFEEVCGPYSEILIKVRIVRCVYART